VTAPPLRVLVLTNMYPPHHYGGYELLCQDVTTALREAGHDVMVLTSDIEVPGVDESPEDPDQVRRDLGIYWADHEIVRPSLRAARDLERRNHAALQRAIADHAPDVVSAWHMGAMSLGLLAACRDRALPIVHVICDDWLVYGPQVDRWSAAWSSVPSFVGRVAERLLGMPCRPRALARQGSFCFISRTTLETAEREGGWRFDDAIVVYSGISLDDFPVDDAPANPWRWRLLHVGRLDDRKGIDTAVRALALLPPEATLQVLGRGDDRYRADLEALISELGLTDRVELGFAERSELRSCFAAADAFVFPPRWAEPFGLVPLEAMACGTPVVATATGGSSEFLLDRVNCLRVPIDDDRSLAAALIELASDSELRDRLVANGRLTATELSMGRWAALLERCHLATRAGEPLAPLEREPVERLLERSTLGDDG